MTFTPDFWDKVRKLLIAPGSDRFVRCRGAPGSIPRPTCGMAICGDAT